MWLTAGKRRCKRSGRGLVSDRCRGELAQAAVLQGAPTGCVKTEPVTAARLAASRTATELSFADQTFISRQGRVTTQAEGAGSSSSSGTV